MQDYLLIQIDILAMLVFLPNNTAKTLNIPNNDTIAFVFPLKLNENSIMCRTSKHYIRNLPGFSTVWYFVGNTKLVSSTILKKKPENL